MAKITITESPKTVKVVDDNDNTHTGRWNDCGRVSRVKGDAMLLVASLKAWTGQVGEWEISAVDLALQGGGY